MGRASTFTQEIADRICEQLADGIPLAVICRDGGMPAVHTVSKWKAAHEAFSADFACAREEGHDAIAARLRDTARGLGESTADVQRDKLIIDTDLKLLAKWDPKRYGDRTIHQGDAANPIATAIDVSGLSVDVLRELAKLRLPE